jgi:hypothetical protein
VVSFFALFCWNHPPTFDCFLHQGVHVHILTHQFLICCAIFVHSQLCEALSCTSVAIAIVIYVLHICKLSQQHWLHYA